MVRAWTACGACMEVLACGEQIPNFGCVSSRFYEAIERIWMPSLILVLSCGGRELTSMWNQSPSQAEAPQLIQVSHRSGATSLSTVDKQFRLFDRIGIVASIARYPVKSMQAELLETAALHWPWLHGDRQYAFVKEADTSAFPWLTARDMPELVRFTARYERPGRPRLTAP